MPRDGAGTYTLPAGNPVAPLTLIESTWANPTMSDIANQLNNVLTRDGLLGPTNQIKLIAGTVSAPGLAFSAEASTGIYRPALGVIGFTVLGVQTSTLNSAGVLSVLAAAPRLSLVATAGNAALNFARRTTDDNAGRRWAWGMNASSESGANVGSDFSIDNYSDTGVFISTSLFINRSNSNTIFSGSVLTVKPYLAASNAFMQISSSGVNQYAFFQFINNGSARWNFFKDLDTESGGNTGSSFGFQSLSDAGGFLQTIYNVTRSNGNWTFLTTGRVAVAGNNSSLGYAGGSGVGGTVTQITNKSTSVTLNKSAGIITLNNALLGAGVIVQFGMNNSVLTADDTITAQLLDVGTPDSYTLYATRVGAGYVVFRLTNIGGVGLSEAIQIKFTVLKGASS